MSLNDITAVIITRDEEPNIGRTLAKLKGLRRIIVLDSGSTDRTLELASAVANVEVVTRAFDTFADQCNFGLRHPNVETDWVLSLDADFVLGDNLVAELAALELSETAGYRARFRYCVFGKVLRCGVYPPVTILFRRSCARFINDGHGHRVVVEGPIEDLKGYAYHDDRKPLSRWLRSQRTYASQEADKLETTPRSSLGLRDRIRRYAGIGAPLMFMYVMLVRGGILDGCYGLFYAWQRAYAELLLTLELLDRRLRRDSAKRKS
jgi:glycosyltransferase involved in cell wall biosynthesis